ncbi:glycoside hydrolase family 92 protein [Collybiopsis luxurians FD-317 M1]|nr:glycoside hydrolase family 92 protein [Collybiopsis luxurians FD-317 M1]
MRILEYLLLCSPLSAVLAFQWPQTLLSSVNPLIGTTGGPAPGNSGGMIASVGPPFASARWVVQTQDNHVQATPFNYTEEYAENGTVHGFQGTRQPAIWMGESAWAAVVPGMTSGNAQEIITDFDERALPKIPGTESFGVALYTVGLSVPNSGGSTIDVSMSATSRVGHLQFTFERGSNSTFVPHLFLPTTRATEVFHTPSTFQAIFPNGTVQISPENNEICGSNMEMQDIILAPLSIKEAASHFTGWFCAEFDTPFSSHGVTQVDTISENATSGSGQQLGAYAQFEFPGHSNKLTVNVKVATSLISADNARNNLVNETGKSFAIADTQASTESAWAGKVGRIQVETDGSPEAEQNKTVFLTALWHAMQYPYEVHDNPTSSNGEQYYSAYDNAVHDGESFNGYSIWDVFRAEWGLLILMAPERIPSMIRSMLHDFEEGGHLPMWKNMVETNIMVGTHADSLLAEAVVKGFGAGLSDGFNPTFTTEELTTMWTAAWQDASVPPINDTTVVYSDRQEGVDFEVRAGLSTSWEDTGLGKGWVANDIHSESASRTLDYSYDDYAVAMLSSLMPSEIIEAHTPNLAELQAQFYGNTSIKNNVTTFLMDRAKTNPWVLWNSTASAPALTTGGDPILGFVQARQENGTWADPTEGFTEGDRWVYSLDIVHDINELVQKRGGNASFIKSMNEFFDGGWVAFTNEPSHHTPYLYSAVGAPTWSQERVRQMASINYNNTPNGLSGNEDCGQMSAWYVWSVMGFYPLNPISGLYVVGAPFFSSLTVSIPVPPFIPSNHPSITQNPNFNSTTNSYELRITATGAETMPYVKSLRVNGKDWESPIISHDDIRFGGTLEFEMSATAESWGGGRGEAA